MKTNNPLFKGARGVLGDFCFRTINGETHLARRPAARMHISKKQAATQSIFIESRAAVRDIVLAIAAYYWGSSAGSRMKEMKKDLSG